MAVLKRFSSLLTWTASIPVLALIGTLLFWGKEPDTIWIIIFAVLLGGSVLAAVHHAEVIAHKVGEPFGSLVLALAVTVIEVALILTLMSAGGKGAETLARDTVFAAIMITCNLIVGLSLLVAGLKHGISYFNPEGSGAALAMVCTLATVGLVLPSYTLGGGVGHYSGPQLAFAAVACGFLWVVYVTNQTRRHRDFFLPVNTNGEPLGEEDHAEPPTLRAALISLALLIVSLVAVVGLAKLESPAIERAVGGAGLPLAFVGVIIALLVLLPECIAAVRNARRNRLQTSLNLAYGSAVASIGLTVPAIALASLWFSGPLELGLGSSHVVLLVLTAVISVLTLAPGRATRMQGYLHLCVAALYIFLAAVP